MQETADERQSFVFSKMDIYLSYIMLKAACGVAGNLRFFARNLALLSCDFAGNPCFFASNLALLPGGFPCHPCFGPCHISCHAGFFSPCLRGFLVVCCYSHKRVSVGEIGRAHV